MSITYNGMPFEVTVQLKNGEHITGRCMSNPIKLRNHMSDDDWLYMCTCGRAPTPGYTHLEYETVIRCSDIVTMKVREVKLQ